MATAGKPHGLGEILSDGYELTDHVVVDDDHTFDGNNEVIEKLITGFKTFKEGVFKQNPELYDRLKFGQEPKMMMITCADSRVCPTMLHGLEAGEAFIVRNVANLVPPCELSGDHHGTSAAIEYAATVLNVENIIVMGHSSCGGIKALMSRNDFTGDFIGSWVQIGMPAKQTTLSLLGDKPFLEQCSFCEQEAVNLSLANLLTFPFIRERLESGRLQIYGMHYDFVEDSLHGALEAERGGAGRLELCGSLASTGGVTPSYGLMKLVKSRVQIPVRVLVRPRAGDFVYSDLEIDVMKADIDTIGQLGFQGVAIGALTPAREIDMKAMHQLLQACQKHQLAVTFHRGFDCVAEPLKALQIISTSLGTPIDRVLTSGQERTAVEGIPLLRNLVGSSSKISILPGAGISKANAKDVVRELGVTELHGSVRKELHVSSEQSLLPGDGNSITWTVDASQVQAIVRLCKSAMSIPNIIAS